MNDSNGLMIDIDSKEQLVEAMKYMYNNIDRYERKNIAMEIVENFRLRLANKIIGIYDEILGKKKNANEY